MTHVPLVRRPWKRVKNDKKTGRKSNVTFWDPNKFETVGNLQEGNLSDKNKYKNRSIHLKVTCKHA